MARSGRKTRGPCQFNADEAMDVSNHTLEQYRTILLNYEIIRIDNSFKIE